MAYVNNAPTRLGMANNAGDQNALFLKQFSGETLAVFEETNVMMGLHNVRSITSGKSAQFPATMTAKAGYHTPGQSIIETGGSAGDGGSEYLSQINNNEVVITINDLLVSAVFISNIDEAKQHWDVRSEYTTQIGRALSYVADRNLLMLGCQGARATGDRFGGTEYVGTSVDVSGDAGVTGETLLDGIMAAAEHFDLKDVPMADRYCVLDPSAYYALLSSDTTVINRDFSPDNGSIGTGTIASAYGMQILKSNHLPTADYVKPAGDQSSLESADYTTAGSIPQALCFQKSGLGTVKLLDLAMESDYQVERQGTLMVAKMAVGHDVLRNECLVELVA